MLSSTGNMGTDIGSLVTHFKFGKSYHSVKIEDATGVINLNLGRVSICTSGYSIFKVMEWGGGGV